jgi:glycosyltransferase involved in cell wall biosynthesis
MFVALMIVRNEASVLPITLGHLLYTVNVDRVIVADNGSSDGTRSILARAVKLDDRVRWTDASGGPYDQQGIATGLALDAYRSGATWLLPTDADEFHWLKAPLRALDVEGVGAWELQVTNFVQFGHVRRETSRSLRTMCFSAVPVGSMEDAHEAVAAQKIAFIQMRYPQKLVIRATKDLIIFTGNHSADNLGGEVRKTPAVEILHAPMRASDSIYKRIEHARRLQSDDPETCWHLRRLLKVDGDKQREAVWYANSVNWGRIGTKNSRCFARLDLRITSIAFRLASFAKAVSACDSLLPGGDYAGAF